MDNKTNQLALFSKSVKTLTVGLAVICSSFSPALYAEASGEKVFDDTCSACHNGGFRGFMSGAPKIGSDDAWKEHFQKGLDQALTDVAKGSDKHESMVEEEGLTEAEVKAALTYIVEKTPSLQQHQ